MFKMSAVATANDAVEPEFPETVQGEHGWLFTRDAASLLDGSQRAAGRFSDVDSDLVVSAWREQLVTNQSGLAESGRRYFHIAVPDKLSLLHTHYKGTAEPEKYSPLRHLTAKYRGQLPCLIDPFGYLSNLKNEKPLFWKSDTRWSPWCCYMTYHCLLYTSPSPRDRQKSRMPSSA